VLDLGWIIPWALAAAWMLRRHHPAGPILAGVILVMLFILSVAMLTVTPVALLDGLGDNPEVRPQLIAFTVIFTVLGVIEALLLATTRHQLSTLPDHWMQPGWWPQQDSTAPAAPGRRPTATTKQRRQRRFVKARQGHAGPEAILGSIHSEDDRAYLPPGGIQGRCSRCRVRAGQRRWVDGVTSGEARAVWEGRPGAQI